MTDDERLRQLAARQAQFLVALAVLEALRQGLEREPAETRDATRQAAREALAGTLPGVVPIFDATLAARPDLARDLLALASEDDAARLLAVTAELALLGEYLAADAFVKRAEARQDARVLPRVLAKVARLAGLDPEARAALADAGTIEPDDIVALLEALPGPGGSPDPLDAEEQTALRRNARAVTSGLVRTLAAPTGRERASDPGRVH